MILGDRLRGYSSVLRKLVGAVSENTEREAPNILQVTIKRPSGNLIGAAAPKKPSRASILFKIQ